MQQIAIPLLRPPLLDFRFDKSNSAKPPSRNSTHLNANARKRNAFKQADVYMTGLLRFLFLPPSMIKPGPVFTPLPPFLAMSSQSRSESDSANV